MSSFSHHVSVFVSASGLVQLMRSRAAIAGVPFPPSGIPFPSSFSAASPLHLPALATLFKPSGQRDCSEESMLSDGIRRGSRVCTPEYAKRKKESLESEFRQMVAKLTVWHFFLRDIHKRASKFRETLIRLGPFYIKLGQALSTRPDILSNAYCLELSKLQDQIPPFPTRMAIKSIESQLGAPISQIFADISAKPIAAASLGQVYKAC